MARLRSLWQSIPGQFQFIQPEAGQASPFTGSFNYVVDQLITLRKANPWLAERYGWRTDQAGVEQDVESQNVARMIAGGWLDFVDTGSPDLPPPMSDYSVAQKKTRSPSAVGGIKKVAAGVATLLDWLGSGGKSVAASLSESRASVCAGCPRNNGGDWTTYFTGPVSEKIRVQLEMKNDLKLSTSFDEKLTVCSACDCPLKLKVHTPLSHVLAHMTPEVRANLDPRCWILNEP